MKFFADLHIHSRFSRATSRSLNLRSLAEGAAKKGITLLGTGDFTHPGWFEEIERELAEAEPGLFKMKDNPDGARFMLTGEISTIYKQGDKVRKVHHLITAPDLECARKISRALARVGNILSDGRPIIGITSRNLLEIVLEAGENAMLIPAHIWTPWFSALGSKSGFDSIGECYGDLDTYIFAVETGLSSDPPMNWMVKSLDRYHLVSNSDAHSVEKLGREATIFDCPLDYFTVRQALKTGEGLHGTIEFFPEEGKYHLDGHRDCNVVLSPEETKDLGGVCPVCGRKVTVGVLNRVEELADRRDGSRPESGRNFYSLIPLVEIIGEILQTGNASKRVTAAYEGLIARLGGELPLLLDTDTAEIRAAAGEVLALAVTRMRQGEVHKEAGYDGNFGHIRVFRDNEQDMLFSGDLLGKPAGRARKRKESKPREEAKTPGGAQELNPAQEEAAAFREGNIIVRAGPGTGKTRTMVERIRRLASGGPAQVLAITFTIKAAQEIRDRLNSGDADVLTFHALAARILKESGIRFHIADEDMLAGIMAGWGEENPQAVIQDMMLRLSTNMPLEPAQVHLADTLQGEGYYTYEGMIREAIRMISLGRFTPAWKHIMADEFQDINPLQYEFLKCLCKGRGSLMVIGDPNQAIYGFRGSSRKCFDDFLQDHPDAESVSLTQTYRLGSRIAEASNAFIGQDAVESSRQGLPIRTVMTPGSADFIAREVESLAGGLSHRVAAKAKADYSLSDIAVIVRTQSQARPVMEALARASIPYDTAYARPLASVHGIAQRVALLEQKDWQTLVKGVGEQTVRKISLAGMQDSELARRLRQADGLVSSTGGNVTERVAALEGSNLFKLPVLEKDHAFYRYARIFGDDTDGFIRFLRLSNDQGAFAGEKVRILTAHAAKGLEFKCVFIAGLSLGTFPLAGEDPAEEENLFYVAMTRAIDLLYLIGPQASMSPFIMRIPEKCCTVHREERKARTEQMLLFDYE